MICSACFMLLVRPMCNWRQFPLIKKGIKQSRQCIKMTNFTHALAQWCRQHELMVSEFSQHEIMRSIRRLPSSTSLISVLGGDAPEQESDTDPLLLWQNLFLTIISLNSHPNLQHSPVENLMFPVSSYQIISTWA